MVHFEMAQYTGKSIYSYAFGSTAQVHLKSPLNENYGVSATDSSSLKSRSSSMSSLRDSTTELKLNSGRRENYVTTQLEDPSERSQSKKDSFEFNSSSSLSSKFYSAGKCGLTNLGNTSFMNSVLQCLSNTKPLLEYCLKEDYLNDINTTTSSLKGQVITAYAKLMESMWKDKDSSVSPNYFKTQIQRFAPRFCGYAQQDAQEFLRYLLEALHEDVNRVTKKPKPVKVKDEDFPQDREKGHEYWRVYLTNDNSHIVDLYVGQLKSELKYTDCGHMSTTFYPFWDLSVPIPKGRSETSLQSCINLFMTEIETNEDEGQTCSKCKKRSACTKSFSIQRFPQILVIHFKRFSQGRYSQKVLTCVDFPESLDMTEYSAERASSKTIYNLYAVSNLSGSVHSGHYTACCKHPYSGDWFSFNDARTSSMSARQTVSSEAYMVFYELSRKFSRFENSACRSQPEGNGNGVLVQLVINKSSQEKESEFAHDSSPGLSLFSQHATNDSQEARSVIAENRPIRQEQASNDSQQKRETVTETRPILQEEQPSTTSNTLERIGLVTEFNNVPHDLASNDSRKRIETVTETRPILQERATNERRQRLVVVTENRPTLQERASQDSRRSREVVRETRPILQNESLSTSVIKNSENQFQKALAFITSFLKGTKQKCVKLDRSKILELADSYKDSDILACYLRVQFIEERGADLGGLTKDAFNMFWKEAYIKFFKGEDAVVPSLPVHKRHEAESLYIALGRIMCHMISLIGTLPHKLCRSGLLSIVYPGEKVDEELLLNDFLLYISLSERMLLNQFLKSSSWEALDQSNLLDFFSAHEMHLTPTPYNLKSSILNMAYSELLDKPMYLYTIMRRGFSDFYIDNFFSIITPNDLVKFIGTFVPTTEQVINSMRVDNVLRKEQETVLYHLKTFIREMTQKQLETFLSFVTGSPTFPDGGIKIIFNRSAGLSRCPTAHTCGNILDLPTTYESYQDFKQEFINILSNDESFRMSVI